MIADRGEHVVSIVDQNNRDEDRDAFETRLNQIDINLKVLHQVQEALNTPEALIVEQVDIKEDNGAFKTHFIQTDSDPPLPNEKEKDPVATIEVQSNRKEDNNAFSHHLNQSPSNPQLLHQAVASAVSIGAIVSDSYMLV